ncbi:asparagine synthase (glutamine-hydrolysing) [Soonwooa buanensis]|uniref:asparagine synthase (glutamine-hydrolyzing) n=1 Tax=Soonwooa buanensis TaxID=619805 RepID=A0A1T5EEC7_9FLAO|nr:asparagine synthase (glutamine-hydrolyzing) [Soonwooa buanensis]SKB82301.1 asparagine synthase (glutamine-hydrolysing) [Soonwooa buanensis]
MCGITGYFSINKKLSSKNILEMNKAITHRGPDDEGFWLGDLNNGNFFSGTDSISEIKSKQPLLTAVENSNIAVGFRRLSILDLSEKGHQPMSTSDGKCIINFNGEIYNFKKIRVELENLGYQFLSQTDTEVILNGYLHWKEAIFEKLDGMFAISIIDLESKKLLLARDRMGLKPLFYSLKKDENIIWASEIKAILKADWIKPEINWRGIYTNFLFQTTLAPDTCFEGIYSLKPAHWLSINLENFETKIQSFWKLPNIKSTNISLEEAQKQVDQLLAESVDEQLFADVPVASMMSGGIDSTLITAKSKAFHNDITAFTISYKFSDQEVENASLVAKTLDIPHLIKKVDDEEVLNNLKENIQHFEEPYCSLEVLINATQFANKKGYKVVLSGNGADELFGGYEHSLKLGKWQKLKKFNFVKNFIFTNDKFSRKVKNYFSQDSMFDFFRQSQSGMRPAEAMSLFSNEIKSKNNFNLNEFHLTDKENYEGLFEYDIAYSLSSHHVFRDDLSAMKYGIEFRYPYLSNKLIDYVSQLPTNIRYNGIINKPLLRKVAQNFLPKEVLEMPKKGFSFPLAYFIQSNDKAKNFVSDNLKNLKKRGFFKSEIIDKWQQEAQEPMDYVRLWQLVTFELWYQKYFEN